MNIEIHDPQKSYCRMLGHEVAFSYCRTVKLGLPCHQVIGCWQGRFDVLQFLQEHYTPEQIQVFLAPPKPKLTSIVELIEQAKKSQAGS